MYIPPCSTVDLFWTDNFLWTPPYLAHGLFPCIFLPKQKGWPRKKNITGKSPAITCGLRPLLNVWHFCRPFFCRQSRLEPCRTCRVLDQKDWSWWGMDRARVKRTSCSSLVAASKLRVCYSRRSRYFCPLALVFKRWIQRQELQQVDEHKVLYGHARPISL